MTRTTFVIALSCITLLVNADVPSTCAPKALSSEAVPGWLLACTAAPVDKTVTRIRNGEGAFHSPRDSDTPHQGVDVELTLENGTAAGASALRATPLIS